MKELLGTLFSRRFHLYLFVYISKWLDRMIIISIASNIISYYKTLTLYHRHQLRRSYTIKFYCSKCLSTVGQVTIYTCMSTSNFLTNFCIQAWKCWRQIVLLLNSSQKHFSLMECCLLFKYIGCVWTLMIGLNFVRISRRIKFKF